MESDGLEVLLRAGAYVVLGLCIAWLLEKVFESRERVKEKDDDYEDEG